MDVPACWLYSSFDAFIESRAKKPRRRKGARQLCLSLCLCLRCIGGSIEQEPKGQTFKYGASASRLDSVLTLKQQVSLQRELAAAVPSRFQSFKPPAHFGRLPSNFEKMFSWRFPKYPMAGPFESSRGRRRRRRSSSSSGADQGGDGALVRPQDLEQLMTRAAGQTARSS